jgi:hypothetical protein
MLAVPKAAAISLAVGLHDRGEAGVSVMIGACVSLINVTVCDTVLVFPHASVTVHVFVTERLQPLPVSVPKVPVAVNPEEQLSATIAVPNAPAISLALGLQERVEAGVNVIAGLVVSFVYEIVCVIGIAVFPHASVADHVMLIE